ncbi:MAG: ribonuclease Z [Eubacteriales bacterium]|nr:ribonuclease Z [Eubacteriales bacterium]
MIEITMLGTSALMPLPDRALTAVLLHCGGRSILFDCGEGTQTAARKAGVSLMKTDIIALTHYHGDHIFGLPGLMQTMFSLGRTQPLYITGPKGLARELAPIIKLAGALTFDVILFEMGDAPLVLSEHFDGWPAGAALKAFETNHRCDSQGYCFTLARAGKFLPERARALKVPVEYWSVLQRGESVEINGETVRPEQVLGEERKGLKIVFTGDTSPCDSLIVNAKDADLLISEATYDENEHTSLALERGHMTYEMAAECAKAAGVRELWLTHFSQRIETPETSLHLASDIFSDTVCCVDGMKKTLSFEER